MYRYSADPKTSLTPVILSYNHAGITTKCVQSVLDCIGTSQLTYLVHNGSDVKVVDELKNRFPQIEHLVLEKNRQFAGGANYGIKAAFDHGAEAVLFLTNDTVLEKCPATLELGCAAYLLSPQIQKRDTGRVDSLGAQAHFGKGRLEHFRSLVLSIDSERHEMPANFYVPGAAFIMNRVAWLTTEGFDEELGSYWEDVDLSMRARKSGVRLGVVPEIVLKHGIGKTCHNNPLYTVYYFHRNRKRVSLRHGAPLERVAFSAVYLVDTLGKSFKLLKKKDFSRLKLLLRAAIS